MISTKKSFILIICLLLSPHIIFAMKRKKTDPSKKQKTAAVVATTQEAIEPIYLKVPTDTWIAIALEDLSSLKTLRQTCSDIKLALQPVALDFLDTTITKHPEKAKDIAQDFYLCTKMLYKYGKEQSEDKFNHLWNCQPINDKGIRTHFVKQITRSIKEQPITPLQVFHVTDISYQEDECDYYNEYYDHKDLNNYLLDALRKKDPKCVHLVSSFALYSNQQLNSSCMKNGTCYPTPKTFFLFEACKYSTIECLQILLDYGAKPGIKINDKKSLLHLILDVNDGHKFLYIENRAQKIELILHYYQKMHPQKNVIVNCMTSGTPLSRAIELFAFRLIDLDELISIIKVLLKYGANPHVDIYGHTPNYDAAIVSTDDTSLYTFLSKYLGIKTRTVLKLLPKKKQHYY